MLDCGNSLSYIRQKNHEAPRKETYGKHKTYKKETKDSNQYIRFITPQNLPEEHQFLPKMIRKAKLKTCTFLLKR